MVNVLDNITESIVVDVLSGSVDDVGVVDGNDHLSTGLCAEHGQDAGSAANVKNDLVLEQVLVVVDEVSVRVRSDAILQHSLVDC